MLCDLFKLHNHINIPKLVLIGYAFGAYVMTLFDTEMLAYVVVVVVVALSYI